MSASTSPDAAPMSATTSPGAAMSAVTATDGASMGAATAVARHAPQLGPLGGPVAGIDIGGTKIAVLIVDADGAVLGRATRSSSAGDQTAPPRPSSTARRRPSRARA
jgi:hypothetical protein